MKCVVFGAGKSGKNFIENKSSNIEIVAVLDNDRKKWGFPWLGNPYNGFRILQPEMLKDYDYDYIVICSVRYEEIEWQLMKMGIDIDKIVYEESIYDYRYSEFYKYGLWRFYNDIYVYSILNKIVVTEYRYFRSKEENREDATNYAMLRGISLLYDPNLSTLNDKIRYLEMNVYGNLERMCTDKYSVRKYVQYIGLDAILIPQYAVVDNIDAVDFDCIPEKFVLKQNNGCAMNYICKDKNSITKTYLRKLTDRWGMRRIELSAYEWHYEGIKKKYIFECLLEDKNEERIKDYKYFCCNGKIACILVCVDRDSATSESYHYYFDTNWNALDYAIDYVKQVPQKKIEKPKKLKEMNRVAEQLAKPFPFVRVDLYNIDGKIYFGELTFTPCGGMITIQSDDAQRIIGSMIDVDYMKNENERIYQMIDWGT